MKVKEKLSQAMDILIVYGVPLIFGVLTFLLVFSLGACIRCEIKELDKYEKIETYKGYYYDVNTYEVYTKEYNNGLKTVINNDGDKLYYDRETNSLYVKQEGG